MLWNITAGQNFAIRHLSDRPDFDVCLKMHLGRKYDIDDWIASAYRALMERDLYNITVQEHDVMGGDIYISIVQTTIDINKEREIVHKIDRFPFDSRDEPSRHVSAETGCLARRMTLENIF